MSARGADGGEGFSRGPAPRRVARPSPSTRTTSYRDSGVDLVGRARAVRELVRAAAYRAPASHGRVVGAAGHFAGLVRVGSETIAVTTDTVGTKVLLAETLGAWEGVGEDLVAVNVNDLASVGARPAGLVDTILFGTASVATFRSIGRGIGRGLARARCSLLGGETAQVGEIVRGIDLGGTAVGFFPRGRAPVLGARIRPGDTIVGLPSNGFHANGYTLLRRLLAERRVPLDRPRPGAQRPVGQELLEPTRIYSPASDSVADLASVHGFAHVSGGGVQNLLRLNEKARFVLDGWPEPPSLFGWVQRLGDLSDREMYRTFNMGIGFALVVSSRSVRRVLRRLARAGFPDAVPIGRVERGRGVELPGLGLRYTGYA